MNRSFTRITAALALAAGMTVQSTGANGAEPTRTRIATLEESGLTVGQYVNRVDYDRSSLEVTETAGQFLNRFDFR